jgi:hypothetical protein
VSSVALAPRGWLWTVSLALQVGFYALAALGLVGQRSGWSRRRIFWVPYYFCVANAAAGAAVLSVVAGVRYTEWEPDRILAAAGRGATAAAGEGPTT